MTFAGSHQELSRKAAACGVNSAPMPDFKPLSPSAAPLSVSELNECVRRLLESQIPLLWVSGEISNMTRASSGHLYFTLKDAGAQVRCTLWRNKAQLLGFRPENGQKVEARALVTLYEARGDYQLSIEGLRLAGQGSLFEQFLTIKATLEAEGLFRPEQKRPLPAFVRRIAVITSRQAAALQDVLSTLARRAPHVAITLYPCAVQGIDAAAQLAQAVAAAGQSTHDLIILCRGGGSLEDLWAFNDPDLARAIRASHIPVISGVGHETDFTIADFAADLRAPTPTSAAEQACPDRAALLEKLRQLQQAMVRSQIQRLRQWAQQLDHLASRLPSPLHQLALRRQRLQGLAQELQQTQARQLERQQTHLQHLAYRLTRCQPDLAIQRETCDLLALRLTHAWRARQQHWTSHLEQARQGLRQLDPHAVLARGYAMVFTADGRAARDAGELRPADMLQVVLARGQARVQVAQVVSPGEAQ